MRRVYLFLWFLTLVSIEGFGQNFQYSIRSYTAVDGLPQSQIVSVVEDPNGYLWLATRGGGLARFDGRDFTVYTTKDGLLSNEIMGLLVDSQQNIWILYMQGVSRFDGTTFRHFQIPQMNNRPKWFRQMFEQDSAIFLVSMNGTLAKIQHDSVHYWDKPVQPDKEILRFYRSKKGTNYFFLNDKSFFIQTPTTSFTIPDTGIEKIYNTFEYKDQVYFRDVNGFHLLDVQRRLIEDIPWQTDNRVILYDDREHFFWTTNGSSLFRETFTDTHPTIDTVLQDIGVYDITIDAEGNTWFGTNGRGLMKYFVQDFDHHSAEVGQGVMAIQKDRNGNTWLGTMAQGLSCIRNGRTISYDDKEPGRNKIHSLKLAPDGTLWVATGMGLGRYDEAADKFIWLTTKDGLNSNGVMSMDFDERGGMWIGTVQGLSYYKNKTFKEYKTSETPGSNMIWYLYYSKHYKTLFVASDFGLQSIKDKDGVVNNIQISGLKNSAILGIQPYRDSLLVMATGGNGTVVFDPVTNRYRIITTDEGLASDFIYLAVQDEKQNIWIGSEKGINRVKLDRDWNVVENLYYGYDNGLTGVETNSNAYLISPKEKYFGLVDGFYKFNDVSNQSRTSFDLHLTDVKIFYGDYSPRDYTDSLQGFFNIPVNPQLPPDKNHLTFHFNRVDKRYSKSVKFKYFLENFDKKWSIPSSMNQVTYSNLPPGDYVFRVMSTDKRGSWNGKQIEYAFSIKAPFYKTASFLVGVVVLIAGIVTLILYLRVKQRVNKMIMLERIRVKEQESLRKEIARDFHDEMGNQLTRIINYISLLKLNGNGSSNGSNDLYTKVEDSAKYLYTGTRDFIWSIDPVNDELSKLFIHIRDFGEKIFEEKSIQFRAFNEVKDKMKLPYGFSREANLIFKEAMTNTFKYSEATNVTFSLRRVEADGFEMSIHDDGVGFSTDETGKSNGLQNIRERADKLGAILRIKSVIQQGTTITLNFKLTKKTKYAITL